MLTSPTPHPDPKANLLENLDLQSSDLVASLPRYDHLVNDSTYDSTLARRQILGHPKRSQLANLIGNFGSFRDDCESMLVGMFSADLVSSWSCFGASDAALDCASRTSTIIAAINIAEEYKNTSRGKDMAKVLLSRAAPQIPQALRTILQALADQA